MNSSVRQQASSEEPASEEDVQRSKTLAGRGDV